MTEANITVEDSDGIKIAHISGQLDESNVDEKIQELYTVVEQNPKELKMIFDLANLEYMNSKSIGYLTDLYGKITESGGKVAIAQARPNIIDILQVVGLTQLIKNYDTIDLAKSGIAAEGAPAPAAAPAAPPEEAPTPEAPPAAPTEAPAPEAPAPEAPPAPPAEAPVPQAPAEAAPAAPAEPAPAPAPEVPAEMPAEPVEPAPAPEAPASPPAEAPAPEAPAQPTTPPPEPPAPAETPEQPAQPAQPEQSGNPEEGTYKFGS